jgi:hypothetical protein
MSLFQEQVYLASSLAGYLELIEKALGEDDDALAAARIAFAKSHTWEASVGLINAALLQAEMPDKQTAGRAPRPPEPFTSIHLTPQDYATA